MVRDLCGDEAIPLRTNIPPQVHLVSDDCRVGAGFSRCFCSPSSCSMNCSASMRNVTFGLLNPALLIFVWRSSRFTSAHALDSLGNLRTSPMAMVPLDALAVGRPGCVISQNPLDLRPALPFANCLSETRHSLSVLGPLGLPTTVRSTLYVCSGASFSVAKGALQLRQLEPPYVATTPCANGWREVAAAHKIEQATWGDGKVCSGRICIYDGSVMDV